MRYLRNIKGDTLEALRAMPAYKELSATGQQSVDLYIGDRISYKDVSRDAAAFLTQVTSVYGPFDWLKPLVTNGVP